MLRCEKPEQSKTVVIFEGGNLALSYELNQLKYRKCFSMNQLIRIIVILGSRNESLAPKSFKENVQKKMRKIKKNSLISPHFVLKDNKI